MAVSFTHFVSPHDVAKELFSDAGFTLDVLGDLAAMNLKHDGGYVEDVAQFNEGYARHEGVSAFLRQLADTLDEFARQEGGER
jgi:hypothetical protein